MTDARGRQVTPLDPVEHHLLHRHDAIEAEALRRIVAEIGPGIPRGQTLFFWACFGLGTVGLILALVRARALGRSLDPVGQALWLVNGVCLVVGLLGLRLRSRRGRSGRVRDVMLRHHRCPHCGYDLRGLPPHAADGAVACPECGCAWRRPPPASS